MTLYQYIYFGGAFVTFLSTAYFISNPKRYIYMVDDDFMATLLVTSLAVLWPLVLVLGGLLMFVRGLRRLREKRNPG